MVADSNMLLFFVSLSPPEVLIFAVSSLPRLITRAHDERLFGWEGSDGITPSVKRKK